MSRSTSAATHELGLSRGSAVSSVAAGHRPALLILRAHTVGAWLCEPKQDDGVGGAPLGTIEKPGPERSCCGSQTSQTRAPSRARPNRVRRVRNYSPLSI